MVEKCEYLSLVNSFDSDNLRLDKPKMPYIFGFAHALTFSVGVYSQPGKELKAFTKADAAVASDLARRKDMALHKDKAWYCMAFELALTILPPVMNAHHASTHRYPNQKKTHVCWRQ